MSNYELGIRIRSDFRQHHTEALKSANHQKALNTVMRQGLQAGKQGAQGLRELETSARSSSNALRHMSHIAGGAWAGLQLIEKAKEASRTAAEIQNIRTRIEGLTTSSSDYANVQNYLVELSERHHKSLLALSDSYSKVLVLEESGILTRKESQLITEGFSNAQSKAGATTEQLKQSLFGMTQGLTAGTLRAEELNQVTEPLPGLLQQLDKAAGLTAGGFRKMVVDGKITSKFFKSTLIKAFESYEGAAERTAGNISAAHADHKNSYLKLVKAYETPISDSTKLVLSASSAVMETFAENAENVSTIIQGAVVLGLAHAANATATYTATKISNIQASRAQQVATIAEAQALQQKAVSLHNSAIQEQAGLTRALALNKNTQMRTVLLRKLAVVNQQVFATENALTAARVRLTAVTTTATIATRGLALASTVLGGPAGIITLAALAIWQFTSASDSATPSINALGNEMDTLKEKFKGMSQEDISLKIDRNTKNIDSYTNKIQQLGVDLLALKNDGPESDSSFGEWIKEQTELEKQIKSTEDAQQILIKQNHVLKELAGQVVNIQFEGGKKVLKGGELTQDQLDKINKKGQTLLDNMRQQAALHGKTSNEAKVRYELEHGNLVAINEDIKKQLILEAQLLDKKQQRTEQESKFSTLRNSLLTPEQKELGQHQSNLSTLNTELDGTSNVAKRQQINQLIELEQQRHTDAMAQINGSAAAQFDALWENTFDRFAAGIGETTASALLESESFGEGMETLAKGAIKSVVAGLIEIGVKQIALAAIGKTAAATTAAATTAIGVGQAGVLASAYAPAAAAVTLATGGANGIPAAATLTATYGLAETLSLAGIAHNGLRKNYDEGTYVIRRDEMMMNPQQRDNFEVLLSHVNQEKQQYKSQKSEQSGNVIQFPDMQLIVQGDNSTPEQQAANAEKMYSMFVNKVANDVGRRGPIGRAIKAAR